MSSAISDVIMALGVATSVLLTIRPVLVGLLLAALACRSARYIVTTAPIDVGAGPLGLCVAVDPADPHGVWWWEPGQSGCSSRSTGPGVFHAGESTVLVRTESAKIEVRFRLPLHGRPGSTMPTFVDVRLAIQEGNMLAATTGTRVPTDRRNDLEVPGKP